MKQTIRFHQGDVIGFQTELPKGANKIKNRPIAYGEHSGHQHCLTGDVTMFEHEGKVYACVGDDGARLQHIHESNFSERDWATTKELPVADHKSIFLGRGTYCFVIQNSYNPYSKLMEQVID